MLRQDFIGRLIEQLGDALARITKLVEDEKLTDAESELAQAEQALGLPRGIERFDARSAALITGNGDKVVLAALILEHRMRLAHARGEGAVAKRHRVRALELLDHAKPNELVHQANALRERLRAAEPAPGA